IECRGLGKVYPIYRRSAHRALEALSLGRLRLHRDLWALRDVTLAVPRGTALGIVGRNGAGKSTLLKILAGTTRPTTGAFRVRGRVSSLLDLGAGFHPEFTGRENAAMSASMSGFGREEIEDRLDAVREFSELGEFLDRPVRMYSSGMVMRLGFS